MSMFPRKYHGPELKCGGPQMCSDCRDRLAEEKKYGTLRDMARLTLFSGRISQLHEKNLKSYPFVFFNGVKKAKIKYDLSHVKPDSEEPVIHNPTVSYYLTIDETAENSVIEKRFTVLEASVRALLWKDVQIEVFFNDKIVYKSTKQDE